MRAGHVEVDLSDRRRVLLCPDVHGAFPALRDRLRQLRWDPAQDALVLLGDLADRGPASAEAPEWTTREGVLRVLGNHDEMPAMLLRREIGPREARMMGGGWFADLPADELRRVATALGDAPIAMTITTPGGRRIGVVHADTHHDWNEQVARLSSVAHDHHDAAVRRSLWRCDTIEIMKRQAAAGEFAARASEHIVRGIDHVFHGHTIVGKAFSHANRSWLDTGAYRGNPFSIVDADQWLSDLRNLALCGERGGNL